MEQVIKKQFFYSLKLQNCSSLVVVVGGGDGGISHQRWWPPSHQKERHHLSVASIANISYKKAIFFGNITIVI